MKKITIAGAIAGVIAFGGVATVPVSNDTYQLARHSGGNHAQYATYDGELHPGDYKIQEDGVTYIAMVATSSVKTATTTQIVPPHEEQITSTESKNYIFRALTGYIWYKNYIDGSTTKTIFVSKQDYDDMGKKDAPTTVTISKTLIDLVTQ